MLRPALRHRLSNLLRTSFSTSTSTIPSVQIRIHHDDLDSSEINDSSSTTTTIDTIHFNVQPQWSEEYELVSVKGGATAETFGDINQETNKLKVDVHVPAGSNDASVVLSVPQRCNVTLMGSKTTNLKHQVEVGGGSGRLEGDIRIFVPMGDINLQKARGDVVELRTANGSVHVKSVMEGLNADISSTQLSG